MSCAAGRPGTAPCSTPVSATPRTATSATSSTTGSRKKTWGRRPRRGRCPRTRFLICACLYPETTEHFRETCAKAVRYVSGGAPLTGDETNTALAELDRGRDRMVMSAIHLAGLDRLGAEAM